MTVGAKELKPLAVVNLDASTTLVLENGDRNLLKPPAPKADIGRHRVEAEGTASLDGRCF